MRTLILLCLLVANLGQANAQVSCKDYLGRTIKPQKAEDLFSQYSKLGVKKGEYETTEAARLRVESQVSRLPAISILRVELGQNFVKYNADSQRLQISNLAFDGAGAAPYGYDAAGIDVIVSHPTHYQFPLKEMRRTRYVATNGFGAKVVVNKVQYLSLRVFDEGLFNVGLFAGFNPDEAADVASIDMSPSKAREVKSGLVGALVFIPKAPYYSEGDLSFRPPSFDNPIDASGFLKVVFGDIKCVLILTKSGEVLAAIDTY